MSFSHDQSWEERRRAMLAETERFIEYGLRHPETINWIPAKRVQEGAFPRKVASWFYQTVFVSGDGDFSARWRGKLRQGIRRIRGR